MISSESAYEQSLETPLIEVYAPLFRTGTREVIAVGEIYDDAKELARELRATMWRTWVVVSVTTLLMLAVLYGIVRRASETIATQRAELDHRVADAQRMAIQNDELRAIADATRLDANEANEVLIGRIGQDLHDGPIQLVSLLMLRLTELAPKASEEKRNKAVAAVRVLAQDIIRELRTLSTGLVLPEIGNLGLRETIELAINRHENLTGTTVEARIGTLPQQVSGALKICVYRIIQESLTNSFRHAGGIGQLVLVNQEAGTIQITVSDKGKGFTTTVQKQESLGLRGIHNRALAFGGHVVIESAEKTGTTVVVTLPLNKSG